MHTTTEAVPPVSFDHLFVEHTTGMPPNNFDTSAMHMERVLAAVQALCGPQAEAHDVVIPAQRGILAHEVGLERPTQGSLTPDDFLTEEFPAIIPGQYPRETTPIFSHVLNLHIEIEPHAFMQTLSESSKPVQPAMQTFSGELPHKAGNWAYPSPTKEELSGAPEPNPIIEQYRRLNTQHAEISASAAVERPHVFATIGKVATAVFRKLTFRTPTTYLNI